MIITTVVVALAFTVITLVQRHMLSIQNNFNHNTELNRLELALWVDFNKAGTVHYQTETKKLVFNQVLDTVSYSLGKGFISRDGDTLNLNVVEYKFYNKGLPVPSGQVDALEWEFSKKLPDQKLMIFKRSDALQYFK